MDSIRASTRYLVNAIIGLVLIVVISILVPLLSIIDKKITILQAIMFVILFDFFFSIVTVFNYYLYNRDKLTEKRLIEQAIKSSKNSNFEQIKEFKMKSED